MEQQAGIKKPVAELVSKSVDEALGKLKLLDREDEPEKVRGATGRATLAIVGLFRGLLKQTSNSLVPKEEEPIVQRRVELLPEEDTPILERLVPHLILAIDKEISACVDGVIHSEPFQKCERAWRGLKILTEAASRSNDVHIKIGNFSKAELRDDLRRGLVRSRMYQMLHEGQYGRPGGKPYTAMIGTYGFSPSDADIRLLRHLSQLGEASHLIYVDAADVSFFPPVGDDGKLEQFEGIERRIAEDLPEIYRQERFEKWNRFREEESTRYVALTLPEFILRPLYSPEDEENHVKLFNYYEQAYRKEERDGQVRNNFIWAPASILFGEKMIESFIRSGWCHMVIGEESGGRVSNLPDMNQLAQRIPLSIGLSDKKAYSLRQLGFLPLSHISGSEAVFYGANSIHKPPRFEDSEAGRILQYSYRLGIQLPYLTIVSRFAHHLKIINRRNIGSFKSKEDVRQQMQGWINQYVSNSDNPDAETRMRRPLRAAEVTLVEEMAGGPGWYRVHIQLKPHIKFEGTYITLELVGEIAKK